MPRETVAITGVGLLCPLGQGADAVFERLLNGEAISTAIPRQWLGYGSYQSVAWAPLPPIDFERYGLTRTDRLRYDPVSMMAIGACHEALGQAALIRGEQAHGHGGSRLAGVDPARVGIYFGTGIGGIRTTLATHSFHSMLAVRDALQEAADDADGPQSCRRFAAGLLSRIRIERRFNPLAVTMLMSNAVSAAPGVRFGITGPCRTTTLACASGTVAVGEAFRAVARGDVDIALAGAAEYLFDEYGSIFRAYDITGALAHGFDDETRANRPFDRDRNGFLFSEGGAAALVIERASHARARGAATIAEIAGFAETFDACNMIAIDESGERVRAMMRAALDDAGIDGSEVDYVNAHGTGTIVNDKVECESLVRVVGEHPLVNSTKGLIGHTIGASGAIEAVVTALSLRDSTVHPCVNLDHPMAPLNFPSSRRQTDLGYALSHSFAFGGHNAGLVLRRAT